MRVSARNRSKCDAPARMKQNDGAKATSGGQQTAAETTRGIADDRHRLDDGPRRDLAQRHRVEELGAGHPVVGHHGVVLHEGDDHETSAIRQRPHLEGDPAQGGQAPDDRSRCSREQKEGGLGGAIGEAALEGDLDQAAAEKDEHEVRTDRGRRGASGQEVAEPADLQRTRIARPPPTRWHEADGGVEGDGGHSGAGASGSSQNPQGRVGSQEQRRESQDDHQPRDDEADAADQRAQDVRAGARRRRWPAGSRQGQAAGW